MIQANASSVRACVQVVHVVLYVMSERATWELCVDQMRTAQRHVICLLVKPVDFEVEMGPSQNFRPFQMRLKIKQWPPKWEQTEAQTGFWQRLKDKQGREGKFDSEEREGYTCALIGGCWHREAGGSLTWSGASSVTGFRSIFGIF